MLKRTGPVLRADEFRRNCRVKPAEVNEVVRAVEDPVIYSVVTKPLGWLSEEVVRLAEGGLVVFTDFDRDCTIILIEGVHSAQEVAQRARIETGIGVVTRTFQQLPFAPVAKNFVASPSC